MSTPQSLPLVCFAEDVCHALGISRSTLKRLRRHGAFPIPEILPPLDKRARWARSAVEAYVEQRQLTHGARTLNAVPSPWKTSKVGHTRGGR